MVILKGLVLVLGYFAIGGIVGAVFKVTGIVTDDDGSMMCVAGWPLAVPVILIIGAAVLSFHLAEEGLRWLIRFFHTIGNRA